MTNSSQPHGLQNARPPCPSPALGVYSNSSLLSWWCHPTISSSVVAFYSCPQSFPASGSFPMSQFFASGGQSSGVSASASVLPMNIHGWFPLGWTGWSMIWHIFTSYNDMTFIQSVTYAPPSGASLPPPTSLGHHRAPRWAPCAVEQLPTSRLFYTRSCI